MSFKYCLIGACFVFNIIFASEAMADPVTVGELFHDCQGGVALESDMATNPNDAAAKTLQCVSYISGFINGYEMKDVRDMADTGTQSKDYRDFCLPDNVTNDELARVFIKKVEQHPEKFHEPAAGELMFALIGNFPCSK